MVLVPLYFTEPSSYLLVPAIVLAVFSYTEGLGVANRVFIRASREKGVCCER